MSPKSKAANGKKLMPQHSSKSSKQETMDVSPAAEQTVMVQLIRQPACAAEEEETQFQPDMVDNGARILREYFDQSEIQNGDIILSIERRSCQFKCKFDDLESDSSKLKQALEFKEAVIVENQKNITDLHTKLQPFIAFGKVSEYLRYFGDTVVLPAIKKECKLATTDILSRVNNWNELLQYLGPFRGRTPKRSSFKTIFTKRFASMVFLKTSGLCFMA